MSTISPTQGVTGRFEVGHAATVARRLMKGTKRHVFLIGLLVGVTEYLAGQLLGPDPLAGRSASLGYYLVTGVISGVALLAYATVGLSVVAGEKLSFSRALSRMHRLPAALMVTVPLTLLFMYLQTTSGVGWWVLCLLLSIPLGFWPLYLVDRDMDPLRAIVSSFKLVFDNLGHYLLYVLLSCLLGALVGLTLGIAVIWVLPFFIIAPAAMFAMAEGLEGDYSTYSDFSG